ncbi:MAG: HEPN domain-containing protein [Planctomycetia bacterium]
MGIPRSAEARPFYRAAKQRFDDAGFLLEAERTTVAVYLSGYSVECMLKALILSRLAREKRLAMLEQFRGSKAREYDWLRKKYTQSGGIPLPRNIAKSFALVGAWSVDLRYVPDFCRLDEAKTFLTEVETIINWADERM